MSRSFKDSLMNTVCSMPAHEIHTNTSSSEDWLWSDKYERYPEYTDRLVSIVDFNRRINLNKTQINATQEANSQFLTFSLPRYQDGFDLMNAIIQIYYINSEGGSAFARPINVRYNDFEIRIGWLLDKYATSVAGKLKFEIQAIGHNSKGDEYRWVTRPNDQLIILESLMLDGEPVEPDTVWAEGFLAQLLEHVGEANTASQEAAARANEAIQASEAVHEVVNTARDELTAAIDYKLENEFQDYYTANETDMRLDEFEKDIIDQVTEMTNFEFVAMTDEEIDSIFPSVD